jgi:hypothetical protein
MQVRVEFTSPSRLINQKLAIPTIGNKFSTTYTRGQPRQKLFQQQRRMQRLLAYLIQIGNSEQPADWNVLCPHLQAIGLDEDTLLGIKSALKVPQCLEDLVEGLDADVAAVTLPRAVSIAMLDKRVNPSEDQALTTLMRIMQ